MDRCTKLYVIGAGVYGLVYYLVETSQEQFTWARFVFLGALLVLLESYDLVPGPLVNPPRLIYPFYKVFTAIILAYLGTLIIFSQIEDFLQWSLALSAGMFEYVPVVGGRLQYGSDPTVHSVVCTSVALYCLQWVLVSVGVLPKYEIKLIRHCRPNFLCAGCRRT